jgi:plastocyanin
MKRTRLPFQFILLTLVIVVVGVGLIANRKSSDKSMPAKMNMSAVSTTEATNKVSIRNYMFMPETIKVKVSTTVTWTNDDQVDHSVTINSGSGPSSSLFGKSQTYAYTFTKAGTYTYHCDVHPQMHGTVIVTN